MSTSLASKIRSWWAKPRGPIAIARCDECGETFRARGMFDLTHYEDADGVACGKEGSLVTIDGKVL